MPGQIHVIAGVLSDTRGRILLAQRPPGSHMAGHWEFPGGKLEPGESCEEGLQRELREELSVTVTACLPLIRLRHVYPDRTILLDIWRVPGYDGVPEGAEGQAIRWVHIDELASIDLLEADRPVIDALRLPPLVAITRAQPVGAAALRQQVSAIVASGVRMLQLRVPDAAPGDLAELASVAVAAAADCAVVINGDPQTTIGLAQATGAAGIHLPSRYLEMFNAAVMPADLLLGASCHDAHELALAAQLNANYALLGPVLPTRSHPGGRTLGWDRFAALADSANLPVYALGGLGPEDLDQALACGAQGVAGISAFSSWLSGGRSPER